MSSSKAERFAGSSIVWSRRSSDAGSLATEFSAPSFCEALLCEPTSCAMPSVGDAAKTARIKRMTLACRDLPRAVLRSFKAI